MTQRQKALLSCAVAAALLLSGCRKGSSDSGSMSSSNAMSGSSGSASTTQTGGWKTGLGILTEASDEARTGTIHTIAAAVLLDGDGKLADVMLDELEVEVTADGKGVVTMPTDYRTKRQKGDDYPLAAASSLKKGWAEQADDFADYLTGMTPEQASMLETDKDGKATDADLLSGLHHPGGSVPRRCGESLHECGRPRRGEGRPGEPRRGGGECLFGHHRHRRQGCERRS